MFYQYVVIFFLWTAVCLYLLLGGADFGAGIVESLGRKKNRSMARKIMYKAIGPVWETNHMWLIIVIVILFVSFPLIYSTLSIHLHIPLVCMLIGIILRGTSYVFRNYDVVEDRWRNVYEITFSWASVLTPFFLGVITASMVSGSIDTEAKDFMSAYIFSWLTPFNGSVGIFTVAICGYLASCYAIAQVNEKEEQNYLIGKIKLFMLVVLFCSALVFIVAFFSHIPLLYWIFNDLIGQVAVGLLILALIFMFYFLKQKKFQWVRFSAAFQVTMILIAVTHYHYPNLVILKSGSLSLLYNETEQKTVKVLAWALMLGSIFILPGVFHLIYSFQRKQRR